MRYLILLLMSFGLCGEAKLVEKTMASVGENIITLTEINLFQKQLRAGLVHDSLLFKIFPKKTLLTNKNLLLDFMVIQQVLAAQVLEKEVPGLNLQISKQLKILKGSRSQKAFAKKIASYGLNLKNLKEQIGLSIKINFLISELVLPKVSVSEADIGGYYFTKYRKNLFTSYTYEFSSVRFKNTATEIKRSQEFVSKLKSLSFEKSAVEMGLKIKKSRLKDLEINPSMLKQLKNLSVSQSCSPFTIGNNVFVLKLDWKQPYLKPSKQKTKEKIEKYLFEKDLKRELKIWVQKQKTNFFVQIHSP